MTEACEVIPVPDLKGLEYESKGQFEEFEERKVYVVGKETAKMALVCIYDVFGYHPNTFQGCDYLALNTESAPLVIMPDFFKGEPLDPKKVGLVVDKTVVVDPTYREKWSTQNSVPNHVPYLEKLLPWIQTRFPSVEKIGLYGFCWGGKFAVVAAKSKMVQSAVLIHPSRIGELDADGVEDVPLLVIASKNESDESLQPFLTRLNKAEYVRMDDVAHGYAAARGDWTDPVQKNRAQETFKLTAEFFEKTLK
ncbi:Alpha/Beta hydrolase protein [Lipomyces oligophaga]|uniref:Alpha/Beta hydrolase protein n=1 Tax=Lipomyces oligophaga TaxID=45792 RepID=UPI0034CE17B3